MTRSPRIKFCLIPELIHSKIEDLESIFIQWMASFLSWLVQLKGAQLRTLATAIGVNSSGTKPVLINALQTQLPISAFTQQSARARAAKDASKGQDECPNVLSIDMGIKNLAYCRLTLPPQATNTSSFLKPTITEWERVNITKYDPNVEEQHQDIPKAKAAFEPDVYAAHAYTLLSRIFQSGSPTHVLIERQRFRSMGGSAVQEWTLRVNMFEAMLYAVLETLKREGRWDGKVMGISPARVASLWLDPSTRDGGGENDLSGAKKSSKKRVTGINSKKLKTQLVREWLRDKEKVNLTGKTTEMRIRAFGLLGKKTNKSQAGKLDDLADCLLQGMAWLKWEENRRLIWEKGKDALLELED